MNNNMLKHYGILGMHWGRKKGGRLKITPSVTKKTNDSEHTKDTKVKVTKNSEDYNKKISLKGKKVNELTNAELKAFNERMQLERQYKDLTKVELTRGQKIVKSIVDSASKGVSDAANDYVKKYAAKQVEKLIEKGVKGL